MSERKWTKGPWEAALERGCHGVIAHALPEGGANFVALVGNDADTAEREPSRFANAHLIAAAPELYEALEKAVTAIEWWQEEHGCCHGATDGELEQAAAALAKARGEAP
ncbi:hypothetical protein [Roseovarius sp.]|uniref:hypothetical protein n=1 Tax=Roseovarius sp. TaxID=1486281 RepID=UPI003BAC9A53